ncbi:hypothetical protein [Spirochaeta isovalerica]|uniref:Uncharacterized protein n=1 Tax=Spirochaeta isovalerica TaxID=150 RepID=A0A841R7C5_9SPIO|nr:hypothetical protein [Spirochaeta isovalerica]MBB6478402.1 hypothetical protein [Spirochaeta isovalerica]
MRLFTYFFSVLILISTSSYYIFGQDSSTIEREEAPAAVWDMDINDSEVDLYITGYWKIGVKGGVSFESGPAGIVFPAAFPGLTDFNFYQEPDVTISLWLKNRYYLETTFLEGFDKNTYAIGYRGQEGEVLQAVRIGNSEITIDDYEGINVPSPDYNTPGVSAEFQTALSSHDVLIRYDPTSEQKKTFLGEYEVTEELIELGNFKRGQYFILPDDNIDAGSLEFYIADKNGIYTSVDGSGNPYRNFRKAEPDEYSYSLLKGTVSLTEPAESDVLVFYMKGNLPIGNDLLGSGFIVPLFNGEPYPEGSTSNFNWNALTYDKWSFPETDVSFTTSSSVTINSKKTLRIFSPGRISPFESYNRYDIKTQLPSEKWKTETFLADNSLTEADDSDTFSFTADPDSSTLIANINGTTDPRSAYNRYPFAESYPQIYTVEPLDRAKTGKVIMLSVRNGNGISLGSGVVPGSEQIYVNGFLTGAATVDYSSGRVTFNRFIYPHDRIEIIYRTETTDLAGGDLLVAQGNRFFPAENLELYFAEMFRWNIAGETAASELESSPGGLTIAGGLDFNTDNFNLSINASGGFNTSNTTGTLRVAGMEESGYSFSAGRDLVKPAPDEIWDGTAPLSSGRTDLTYTDYLTTDGLGQYFLNTYTWNGAIEDTEKEGPSPASELSSDPFDGNVMVFDYSLGAGQWSAGDLLLSSDGPIDLSNYESVSLYLWTDNPSEIDVKLLLGENGEAEDYDGDSFTDDYDEAQIVTIDISTSDLAETDNNWYKIEHEFTPIELKKLSKSRSARIIIEEKTSPTSGRLMAGGLHFEGSIFKGGVYTNADPDNEIDYSSNTVELTITEARDATAASLSTEYPETVSLFHSSGDEQKAVKIYWDLTSGDGDYWTSETHTTSVSPESYGVFSFYAHSDTISGSTYNIDLTDSRNRGYHFTYSPSTTNWEKLNLSLETGNVTDEEGNQITAAVIDENMGELNRFSIKGQNSISNTGTLYLDELHYSDPSFSLDGTVDILADYRQDGLLLASSGGFPFFADFFISNNFTYYGGKVLSDVSDSYHSLENYTSIGITMLLMEIQANAKISYDKSGTDLAGSHSLLFPSGFSFGTFTDNYSRSGSDETTAMFRSNSLKLAIPGLGFVAFSTEADGNGDNLVQSWSAETDWALFDRLTLNLKGQLEQTELWDFRDSGNYFSNWILDYKLLVPFDENVSDRNFSSSFHINLDTQPVGFSFTPSIFFDLDEKGDKIQSNRGNMVISIPLTFMSRNDKTWSLTPSYSRIFTEKSNNVDSGSYRQGFINLFDDLATWMPLTSFIPFYELFAQNPVNTFEEKTASFNSASYTPEFAINFSRNSGSTITDLFLPDKIDLSFSRTFTKTDDSYSNVNTYDLTIKQSAINLFGRFGVYETFDFYDSEDITSSVQFVLEGRNGEFPTPKELVYQNYFAFYGKQNRALTLENRFSTQFVDTVLSDTLDFKFLWSGEMKEKFALDFINNIIDKEHFWSHEESLQLEFNHPWQVNEEEVTSFNIFMKHLSTINVPGLGALRGWLTLGFYTDDELFRTGFEAGIEMEISF